MTKHALAKQGKSRPGESQPTSMWPEAQIPSIRISNRRPVREHRRCDGASHGAFVLSELQNDPSDNLRLLDLTGARWLPSCDEWLSGSLLPANLQGFREIGSSCERSNLLVLVPGWYPILPTPQHSVAKAATYQHPRVNHDLPPPRAVREARRRTRPAVSPAASSLKACEAQFSSRHHPGMSSAA